ncbi:hypothetical protein [Herbaspirillum huttiense]|uniref:Uncharacterized protein n=2 Tax=Herbaspirillum huttiense TaxID=863372 RepID=A0AAJ2HBZ6_9BURK|nr:hypothetical protein [Herbaspirillum huttiense]MDR9838484.1 hypothetical protein [Herbaspirillum huttiense]
MNYSAQIKYLGDDIEEEVLLRIHDLEITCFVTLCPFRIETGKSYMVELEAQVFDDYFVREISEDCSPGIVRVGSGFTCIIWGRLIDGCLNVGDVIFYDDVLLAEFGQLNGKMVEWEVDRIDVNFVSAIAQRGT